VTTRVAPAVKEATSEHFESVPIRPLQSTSLGAKHLLMMSTRVVLIVDAPEPLAAHMRIDLRGADVRVAEHEL